MGTVKSSPPDLWVFGYGSLIWQPGFEYSVRRKATLQGYRRSFCMTSVHYRGTPERPGLVLALDVDAGGICEGVAYGIPAELAEHTLAYLRERELVSYAYDEARVPVRLETGEMVESVTYVTNRDHPQYSGDLNAEEQADVIASAVGPKGPNAEYLINTIRSLETLGLRDDDLQRLAELVRQRLPSG
jgi:glutathione-specific gamma-glutamylcyclotransferase